MRIRTCLSIFCLIAAGATCTKTVAQDTSFERFFDLNTGDQATGPPYPTQSVGVQVFAADPTDVENSFILKANINGASEDGSGGPMPLTMLTRLPDPGPTPDVFFDVFFDVYYSGGPGDFTVDSFFDITYQLELPGGGGPGDVTVEALVLDHEPFVFYDIILMIDYDDDSAPDVRLVLEHELAPGLTFGNAGGGTLTSQSGPDSFFDVFYDITLSDPGAFDPSQPLFSNMSLRGSAIPEPSSLFLAMATALGFAPIRRR